jgi:hypothetical protein
MKTISMRGQIVDMARLAAENADKPALGNASMNARGDLLGTKGQVVKSREDITRDYHVNNPKAVRQMSLRDINREVFVSPAEAVAAVQDQPDDGKRKRKIID